jgi:hypothetical protein
LRPFFKRFVAAPLSQKSTQASAIHLQARFNNAFGLLPLFCDFEDIYTVQLTHVGTSEKSLVPIFIMLFFYQTY